MVDSLCALASVKLLSNFIIRIFGAINMIRARFSFFFYSLFFSFKGFYVEFFSRDSYCLSFELHLKFINCGTFSDKRMVNEVSKQLCI